MANFGNPAMSAAIGNAPGMMLIAGGAMSLAQGLFDGLDALAESRRQHAYGNALSRAVAHADDMEDLARVAVHAVAELEAEVASLRAACRQRQDYIDRMKARA